MNFREFIAEIAEEISEGARRGKYDATYFLDGLIDRGFVKDYHVSALINGDADARATVASTIRCMVKHDAIAFFEFGNGYDDAREWYSEYLRDCADDAKYRLARQHDIDGE